MEAIEKAGYTGKVKIGMDVAASEFYTEDKKYDLDFKTEGDAKDKSQTITGDQLTEMYQKFCSNYPVISIEDPFDQVQLPTWAGMGLGSLSPRSLIDVAISLGRTTSPLMARQHPCLARTARSWATTFS